MRIRVPATTANLGPGFDTLGLALRLYLEVEARAAESETGPEFIFSGSCLPSEGIAEGKNLILRAARAAAASRGVEMPSFIARVTTQIPLARGLGSSAAAILAGIYLANGLCGLHLLGDEVLSQAVALERGHADNVAAALSGGLTISWCEPNGEMGYFKIAMHPEIKVVLIVPEVELATQTAREVLPNTVSRADAVYNLQHCAVLVAGLQSGDRAMIRRGLQDRLHQPHRMHLIPGLRELLGPQEMDGLLGVALSGAGSSVVAFADHDFEQIGDRLRSIFEERGIAAEPRMLDVDTDGVVVETS